MSTRASQLSYRGFQASVDIKPLRKLLVGRVLGVSPALEFSGESVASLIDAFHRRIDAHIEACAKAKRPVRRAYSGTFQVRISPDLHRRAAEAASELGVPLTSDFVAAALTAYLDRRRK
jgi:predicted HicB family RNase H-like nuclease